MGEVIFEFLGDTLLVMVELFPYGAIGLLGYAWGADNEIKHKQEYAKQYANKRIVEVLVDIKNNPFQKPDDSFQEAYSNICLKIVDKIKELKEKQ